MLASKASPSPYQILQLKMCQPSSWQQASAGIEEGRMRCMSRISEVHNKSLMGTVSEIRYLKVLIDRQPLDLFLG